MKPTLLYRIAAVLFVLFAAVHTIGFLRFVPPTAEGVAVRDSMRNVHFALGSGTYSYANFYEGFGLSVSVYLLFAAFLAWQLGNVARRDPSSIRALSIALFVMQLAQLAVCLAFFFAAPIASSTVIALCLGLAAWRVHASA